MVNNIHDKPLQSYSTYRRQRLHSTHIMCKPNPREALFQHLHHTFEELFISTNTNMKCTYLSCSRIALTKKQQFMTGLQTRQMNSSVGVQTATAHKDPTATRQYSTRNPMRRCPIHFYTYKISTKIQDM